MHIGVLGLGYVGKTVAACLASRGHSVTAVDIDPAVASNPVSNVHEEELRQLLQCNLDERIHTSTDYSTLESADVIFVTLPTPSNPDGSIDLSIVLDGVERLSEFVDSDTTVVIKSTVTPTTTENRVEPMLEPATVLVNPEFLREGSAVQDFTTPDKIVIGCDDEETVLHDLYDGFDAGTVITTGKREAEMIKYANNTFLATKISTINEIGNICKELGIDSYEVAEAVGADSRISGEYLQSGLGFGGSCLPKDVRALRESVDEYDAELLDSVLKTNQKQPRRAVKLLSEHIQIDSATIAVLGLAFKPNTSDTRNSQSKQLVELLEDEGATVEVYDPAVTGGDGQAVVDSSDGVVIATAWDEFEQFDYSSPEVVVDGRRVVDGAIGLTW